MRLTKDEIIFVSVILAMLAVGATVKHYRQLHPAANFPPRPPAELYIRGERPLTEAP